MHAKALLFDDEATAQKILKASSPRKMRALGRKAPSFDDQIWERSHEQIACKHSVAKFRQNEALREALLATGDRVLVEASPSDSTWGAGLNERDAAQLPASQWPGLNLLGKALMRVRDSLQSCGEEEESAVKEGVASDASSQQITKCTRDHERCMGQARLLGESPAFLQ